ncbi:MAG: GNAT family N-acetyltransferase [Luteolibacter sp.]
MDISRFKLDTLGADDSRLQNVVNLWRIERKRLGLFPRGAFEDYARAGGIHVALNASGDVVGYAAVRVAKEWSHIAHLCVDPSIRRSSVASELVQYVAEIAVQRRHLGIRLKCRSDYEANNFWPRTGFHCAHKTPGKAADSTLLLWIRRSPNVDDFFNYRTEDRKIAVLDANVFFDLGEDESDWDNLPIHIHESLYLGADWVADAIDIGVVDEIYTEIHRNDSPEENLRQRIRAQNFVQVSYESGEVSPKVEILRSILGWKTNTRPQQESDMRQIAKAASSKADFFVTRDSYLLDASAAIFSAMSIRVVTPAALLGILDEEERGHLYSPAKILGTELKESSPRADEIDAWADRFIAHFSGEPKSRFQGRLRALMAASTGNAGSRTRLLSDSKNRPILLLAHRFMPQILDIQLLRAAAHSLSPTVVRHYLLQLVQMAASQGCNEVTVNDQEVSPPVASALTDLGFSEMSGTWRRHLCSKILKVSERSEWPEPLKDSEIPDWQKLEHGFWPVKIEGVGIESVSLTIKPHWAAKLFDFDLAGNELFPVDPAKVINRENVFYRSPTNWPKNAPGRIIWYVSGISQFRACSTIIEVQTGPASAVFKRFSRLGIYEWRDLQKITQNDPHGTVMAIRFADTEIFDQPIDLSEARKFGIGKIVVGAHAVPESGFLEAYRSGMARFSS